MSVAFGDKLPSYSTVKNWVAGFRTGHLSNEGGDRPGRPTESAAPENLDAIHSMVLDNERISTENIAETLASRYYYSRDFRQEKALGEMSQC
jgi:transposase